MGFRLGTTQPARIGNVTVFLVRLANFFRHPLAAADVPAGASWTRADDFDPWADGFWS